MDELKKCPFCGGEAKLINYETKSYGDAFARTFYVKCSSCHIQTPYFQTKVTIKNNGEIDVISDGCMRAVSLWNYRIAKIDYGAYRDYTDCVECKYHNVSEDEFPFQKCAHGAKPSLLD